MARLPESAPAPLPNWGRARPPPPVVPSFGRRERALGVLLFVAAGLASWGLGGMLLGVQLCLAALGLLALGLLAIPFGPLNGCASQSPAECWQRLRTLPVFWLGLAFFGYLAVQGLNPWAELRVHRVYGYEWLKPRPHLAWLPAGVAMPLAEGGPWRMLVLWLGPWALACALWAGFERRRAIRLLWALVGTATVALGFVAILQWLSREDMILGRFPAPYGTFWATFVYPNHAAAFFNLGLAVVLALALHHQAEGRKQGDRSAPGLIACLLAGAACLVVSVVLSQSRAGLVLAGAIVGLYGLLALWLVARRATGDERWLRRGWLPVALAMAALLGGAGLWWWLQRPAPPAPEPTAAAPALAATTLPAEPVLGWEMRATLYAATFEMWQARPLFGHGAMAYAWTFRPWQEQHPALMFGPTTVWAPRFEYAHQDFLHLLAELGLVGLVFPVGMLGNWGLIVWRYRRAGTASLWLLGAGAGATLVHAGVDFVFFNPGVLVGWAIVVAGAARHLAIAHQREARDKPE